MIGVMLDLIQQFKGRLSCPEIRVWCHGSEGDDYYYVFDTFNEAFCFIASPSGRDELSEDFPMIAYGGYEFNIFNMSEVFEDG